MGRKLVWQTPLAPAEVREFMRENVDTRAGIPMFHVRGSPAFKRGYRPLAGTFNAFHFRVQVQPDFADPFATFCSATVRPGGPGSRITTKFGFHGLALVVYFLGFGWTAFVAAMSVPLTESSPARRLARAGVVLAVAAIMRLFARWRQQRDTPVLEEFLVRKLALVPDETRPTASAAQAAA